jgi:integrase/recombinase XerD
VTLHIFRFVLQKALRKLKQAGASVRHMQQLLGHRDLSTTEIYTHVEIQDLKQAIESAATKP